MMDFFARLFRRRKPAEVQSAATEAKPAATEEATEARPAVAEEAAIPPAPASEAPQPPLEQEAAVPPAPTASAEDTVEKQASKEETEAGSDKP